MIVGCDTEFYAFIKAHDSEEDDIVNIRFGAKEAAACFDLLYAPEEARRENFSEFKRLLGSGEYSGLSLAFNGIPGRISLGNDLSWFLVNALNPELEEKSRLSILQALFGIAQRKITCGDTVLEVVFT